MRGFTLRFEPVRKQVPIYLATLNPKSVKMTAEIADGWMPVMIPFDRLPEEVNQVREWAAAAGRDPDAFTVRAPGGVTVANTKDAQETARRTSAGTLAFYCARMGDFYYRQLCRHGFQVEADAVREAWREGGSARAIETVPRQMQDRLGFIGTTEECVERLEQEEAAGVKLHSVTILDRDPDARGKIIEQLAG